LIWVQDLIRVQNGEVHLWRWDLDRQEARPDLLSEDERARAGRFHFERDARRWAACRTRLRVTLGRYLETAPERLEFEVGPWGKPGLRGCPLRFNVSHCGGAALLALAWRREVGVDMEDVGRDLAAEELAPQVLSNQEQEWLAEHAPEQRPSAFLTLWTAKEAYVKAAGQGLSFPMARLTLLPIFGTDRFQASALPPSPPLTVRRIDAGPDYFAALAIERPLTGIRRFEPD